MDDFETAKRFFLEGLQLLEVNNLRAAETQFARSLELLPNRVSTLNNLSAIKIKQKQFAEAEEFARKAIAVDEKSPEAWANLGNVLTATARMEEAVQACDRAIQCEATFVRAWLVKAAALLDLKRYDEALVACDEALKLDSSKYEVLFTKSLILKGLERLDEAKETHRKSFELRIAASPVYKMDRRDSQQGDILILTNNRYIGDSLSSFEDLHIACPNYAGQTALRLQDEFHFTYAFIGDAARTSARQQIPQPDFVINNEANGEQIIAGGNLEALSGLMNSFGVPVVNHPTKAVETSRDRSVKRLEGTPGVLVPKTKRFGSMGKRVEEVVCEIEEHFDYPLITRSLTAQRGRGMDKMDSREALTTALAAPGFPKEFFVTQFVDSRGGNKLFRKIRAAVVRDEIFIMRVDHHTIWKVHGRKKPTRVPFYLENPYLLDEERRIIFDPEAGLGKPALQALRALRERVPLDVFGIDFEVDADGRVVFYEANATMNLFSTACKEVPNPKEADENLKGALQRYFTSLVARR